MMNMSWFPSKFLQLDPASPTKGHIDLYFLLSPIFFTFFIFFPVSVLAPNKKFGSENPCVNCGKSRLMSLLACRIMPSSSSPGQSQTTARTWKFLSKTTTFKKELWLVFFFTRVYKWWIKYDKSNIQFQKISQKCDAKRGQSSGNRRRSLARPPTLLLMAWTTSSCFPVQKFVI